MSRKPLKMKGNSSFNARAFVRFKTPMAAFVLTALIFLFGRTIYFTEPMGVSLDESTYLAVAETWHHYDGGYADGVDRKPPLHYGLYYGIGKIFGFFNIHGVHIFFFLWMFVLCWLCEQIVQLLKPSPPKGLGMILAAIISSSFTREFISGNAEHACLLPLLASFWILLNVLNMRTQRVNSFFAFIFLASVLAAIATTFKQVAALPYAAGFTMFCLWLLFQKKVAKLFIAVGALVTGLVTVYGLLVLYYYLQGELSEFLYWNLADNFSYIQDTKNVDASGRPVFLPLIVTFATWPVFWWGLGVETRSRWKDRSPQYAVLLAALIGAWLLISLSGRLFSHYFVPLAFFLVLVSSYGIWKLLNQKRTRVVSIVGLTLPFMIFFTLTTFRDEVQVPLHKPVSFSKETQKKVADVAEYIREHSQPHDRIAVWGMAPQLYILSERGSGTRFIPADYPSGRMAGMPGGARHPHFEKYLELYLDDLQNKKPLYFVDTASASLNGYQNFPLERYPALLKALERDFKVETVLHNFTLWRRRS